MHKSRRASPSLLGRGLVVLSILVFARAGQAQTACPAAATSSAGCADTYSVGPSTTLLISGGGAACLVCGAGGPQAGTTWMVDHSTVPAAVGSVEGDGTLVIYEPACIFTVNQAKQVQCSSGNTESHSSFVFLKVFVPPDVPDRVTVNESDALSISCSDRDSTIGLVLSLRWEHENATVDDDKDLMIESVTRHDTGVYTCVAQSSDQLELQSNTSVIVQYSPTVAAILPSLHLIPEGETLSLSCDYEAVPPPTVSWSLGGNALDSTDPRVNITSSDTHSELTLTDVGGGDGGEYSCTAVNLLGSDETTTTVIVQVVPDPPVGVQVINSTTESLTLSWTLGHDGFGTITSAIIQYKSISLHDTDRGNHSASGQPTMFTINNLQPNTVYEVEVYLENVVGRSDPSVINASTLYLLLEAPSIVNYTAISLTELILEWMSPNVNPLTTAPVTGWIVQYRLCTANRATVRNITDPSVRYLNISDLVPGTEYCARVAGYSEVGTGAFSGYARAMTVASVPSVPQNFTASIVSSHGVWLSWTPPQYDHGGTTVGYIVEIRDQDGQNVLFRAIDARMLSLTIQNELMELETYSITVAAVSTVGTGSTALQMITTLSEESPQPLLSAPFVVEVVGRTVLLSWASPGGTIQEYIIQYKPEASDWSSEQTNEITAGGLALELTLCCLTATTLYDVRIQTVNERGQSVFSPEATFYTGVSLPLMISGSSGSVSEGTTIFLNCTYQDGSIPPAVQWTRLNRALPSSSVALETVLVLADVEITDGGEFVCSLGAEGEEASLFLSIISDNGGSSSSMATILIAVIAPAVVIILLVIGIYSTVLFIVRRRSRMTDPNAQGDSSDIAISFINPGACPSLSEGSPSPRESRYSNSKQSKEPVYAEPLNPKEKRTWSSISQELKIHSNSDAGQSVSRTLVPNPIYQVTAGDCEAPSKPMYVEIDEL